MLQQESAANGGAVYQPLTRPDAVDHPTAAEEGRAASSTGSSIMTNVARVAVVCLLLSVLLFVLIDSFAYRQLEHLLVEFVSWVRGSGAKGVGLFVGVYALAVVLFIPASVLTLGAGFAFVSAYGLAEGLAIAISAVFVGASIGAVLAFGLARYVFRGCVRRLSESNRLLAAVDKAVEQGGLYINVLMRLSPMIPFTLFNYVMGSSRCRFVDYLVGLGGILPGTIAYVYIGALPASAASGSQGVSGHESALAHATESSTAVVIRHVFLVLGLIAMVGALVVISRLARRALTDALSEDSQHEPLRRDEVEGSEEQDTDKRTT
ncbi:unnamed protein product [Vitrella brassicaformis CCMP3155]|uniref:VTT domain-containing protein n=2 Tax=Vitrella brassicaformis TaxID=1169539 RepID=A0A0G4EKS6_VITBC|nr:unnamed protein product [Vitrella brassicaformis CCMP3155]|eukprot:CEL97059.1 unnamed protein product [Vitrella brassicaformis CCMP3155]